MKKETYERAGEILEQIKLIEQARAAWASPTNLNALAALIGEPRGTANPASILDFGCISSFKRMAMEKLESEEGKLLREFDAL